MRDTPRPLFILSLPRSGSTLLQRLIAAHRRVSTTSEPWLLLPFMYSLRSEGSYSDYGHLQAVSALRDFCDSLPNQRETYEAELRTFAIRLYQQASDDGSTYFLDKTPRYHLIVDDLIRIFPEASLIFLWRNPLAVVASMMEHAAPGGRWNLYLRKIDLFQGLEQLLRAHEVYQDRALALRYEELVMRPQEQMARVWNYLGLDPATQEGVPIGDRPAGRMGDDTGTYRYEGISEESVDHWRTTLNTPLRKAWSRRYLAWIGEERLTRLGYDLPGLTRELAQVPLTLRRSGSDLVRASYGVLWCLIEPHLLRPKLRKLTSWRRVYGHT